MAKRKLQVFLSSTFTDMKNERQAAVSAILKAGHIPAGMELFTAGDRSQMEIIERWIDESDVYMLLLGGRYGSVEPKSEMGYTELEYNYALSQGKPLFAVVIADEALEAKVKEFGTDRMEKFYPQRLSSFRATVLSNMSAFYSDEKDIRLAIYESLSDFAANRDLKGWVSADEVGNSQLLQQEINSLRESNANLMSQVTALKSASTKPSIGTASSESAVREDLRQIAQVLADIEVEVPKHLRTEENKTTNSLLNIFYGTKEFFVSGITNQHGMADAEQFLFFNIAPRLQVHGLTGNEKVPAKPYRRVFVTQKGLDLLASIDLRLIAKAKRLKKNSADEAPAVE